MLAAVPSAGATAIPATTSFLESAPVLAALVAAIGAALVFMVGRAYEYYIRWQDYERSRRGAIVLFTVDIKTRYRALLTDGNPADDDDYVRGMIDTIYTYADEGRKFRVYGVTVKDADIYEKIKTFLATLPTDLQELIWTAIQLDKQMVAEYEAMQSQAFEDLTAARQAGAFHAWLKSVEKLMQCLGALIPELDRLLGRPEKKALMGWIVRLQSGGG